MITEQFVTFQKYYDYESAVELAELFKENGIEYVIENNSPVFDANFANNAFEKEFRVKIKKQDFLKADNLLKQIATEQIEQVDKNYYLFKFTDDELMEIIIKRDEWGNFDFLLAQKLLKERGKEISPELVELLRKQRIQALAEPEPEKNAKVWIYCAYTFSILGGILGIFLTWHILVHKKTLPNGDIVFAFSEKDRKSSKKALIISIIFVLVWFALGIIAKIENYIS